MSKIKEMIAEMEALMKKYELRQVKVVYAIGSIEMTTTLIRETNTDNKEA